MKFSLLAFATAVAAAPAAEVFIFDPAVTASDSPEVSREVARLIFAHRLRDAPDERGPALPDSVSSADLDAKIEAFGKPRQSLFASQRTAREPQLVVIVEGATQDTMRDVTAALDGGKPAFTIPEPPSEEANHDLVTSDFAEYNGPWVGPNSCPLDLALNSHEQRCWDGDSLVVKYDAKKDPKTMSLLVSSLSTLKSWASSGELETTVVLLPESSRVGSVDRWSAHPSRLSRRQKETVIELDIPTPTSTMQATRTNVDDTPSSTGVPGVIFTPDPVTGAEQFADNSVCYASRSKCMNETYGCFRHGTCKEQTEGCFKCVCGTTQDKFGVETQWTGNMCQKADVSLEFWMFFGVGLLTFFALGGGLTMLIGVGMEELPGVLGAGVVKSK